ncbi:hypothetical protein AALP_AA1G297700 [Arabis alpina]|uniref:Uncharacterized protein n=1 Tax=Arabis alpina TaxID=50452 RepID=A0A087HRJ5_ARAAL|nr:hypothetical protein AALP_AA1G297700 [Arabis alpina]
MLRRKGESLRNVRLIGINQLSKAHIALWPPLSRASFLPQCGQLRVWIAKDDGIYFTRKLTEPPVLALRWKALRLNKI